MSFNILHKKKKIVIYVIYTLTIIIFFIVHNDKITNRNKNKRKPKVDPDVKEMIRKNFTHEYEFYYFCKQRLYKQYLAANLKELQAHGLLD